MNPLFARAQFDQGRGAHKVQAATAKEILLSLPEAKYSWEAKMVITDDRIRQYFSSRKQKEKASIRDNSRGKKNTTASAASSTTTTTTTTTTKPAVGGMQSHPITQIPTQPSLNITVEPPFEDDQSNTQSLFFNF